MVQTRFVRAAVSFFFVMSVGTTYASLDAATTPAAGALSVSSDPPGADVYVDGQLSGHTPFTSDKVSAGDHRVKILKDGYLENARIVTVAASKTSDLNVKLTVQTGTTMPPAAPAKQGGNKTLLWVAIAGGAGAGIFLATRGGGKPPTVATPTATPTLALVGVNVTFTEIASDPDNDMLTYSWDFGDGSTPAGTGAAPAHAYATAGTFNVVATVSDGSHKVATSPITVTAKSDTGTWKGSISGSGFSLPVTVLLSQNGNVFGGTYTDSSGSGVIAGGLIPSTGVITLTVNEQPFQPFILTGIMSADLNTMTGSVTNFGAPATFSITRQ